MEARIQAAFGALGGAVPAWSLAVTAHTVCVPAPEFSDEEDVDAADGDEAEAWVQVCEERGDALPTAAFCRALEREAEYDESDQLATGEGEAPPPLCTAVTVEEEEEEDHGRLLGRRVAAAVVQLQQERGERDGWARGGAASAQVLRQLRALAVHRLRVTPGGAGLQHDEHLRPLAWRTTLPGGRDHLLRRRVGGCAAPAAPSASSPAAARTTAEADEAACSVSFTGAAQCRLGRERSTAW